MPHRPDRPSHPPGGVRTDRRPDDFPDRLTIAGLEGGSVSIADQDGRWFLIFDDSGLGLDEDELEALRHRLGRVEEFPSAAARDAYVQARFRESLLPEPRPRRRRPAGSPRHRPSRRPRPAEPSDVPGPSGDDPAG